MDDELKNSWDNKIDHMDSYLAELGGGHLKLMEGLKRLQKVIGIDQNDDAAQQDLPPLQIVQTCKSYAHKISELEKRID
eukprot:13467-Amphidinium_carterae.1